MSESFHVVTGLPHAYVTEDASIVQLTFSTDGEDIRLSFSAEQFDLFTNRAIQLFTHVRSQRLAIGDHLAVRPVGVAGAGAEAAAGGEKVILTLLADNGVPYHFALSLEQASDLRPHIRNAEESARRQRSQTRQ
jgi:hypothetical protein